VHVAELARALAHHVDVQVACFGAPRPDPMVIATVEPWSVLPATREGAALGALSADLVLAAAVEGADLVHTHTWYAHLTGLLAKLLWGAPHVATCHSLEPLRPWKADQLGGGYAVSSWAERVALESADVVIAVSAGMRDDVLSSYPGVDPGRVAVIHNGIDPERWAPDQGTDVLERLGIDPERPYVLWVGRVTRQKGIDHLVEAASLMDPAAALVLCAGGADTAELASETTAAVSALRANRLGVHWIDAMLPRRDVVQLMSRASCFVCPSTYEPFGLINIEAMSCGTPVVASAVGGIPEIVLDGVTGRLVPFEAAPDATPADPRRFAAELAATINELVADPTRAEAMGCAGRERVLEHFTWSAIAAETAELYRQLLAG
jgi:starch synthase